MQVHVILFGVGSAETEGIYSLRAMSRDDGVPKDTIIAFESEDDATRCVNAIVQQPSQITPPPPPHTQPHPRNLVKMR